MREEKCPSAVLLVSHIFVPLSHSGRSRCSGKAVTFLKMFRTSLSKVSVAKFTLDNASKTRAGIRNLTTARLQKDFSLR